MSAPEVVDGFLQQVRLIGDQVDVERRPGFVGMIPEHPVTKPVDRKDCRLVKMGKGLPEALNSQGIALIPGRQGINQGVPGRCTGCQGLQRLADFFFGSCPAVPQWPPRYR